MDAPDPELEFAIDAVRRAGALIRSFFGGSYELRAKGENNPVTSADLAADALLRESFGGRFPDDGWLSEETADSAARLARPRVWIVDPLDGTREFVQGLPEIAVSLALVDQGDLRLAVVYNPVRDELYAARRGRGAWRETPVAHGEEAGPARERLQVSARPELSGARLLASRSEESARLFDPLHAVMKLEQVGSIAYRLALVAAGAGDATLSLRAKSEWDVAGGALIVEEAGGRVSDVFGAPLRFNLAVPLLPGIVAGGPQSHGQLVELLERDPALRASRDRLRT
jgi:myo-inositol-1(or 4)-monophosphatase